MLFGFLKKRKENRFKKSIIEREEIEGEKVELEENIQDVQDEKQRKQQLQEAEGLIQDVLDFCDDIFHMCSSKPSKVHWGRCYFEAKKYRSQIQEQYPLLLQKQKILQNDLILVKFEDDKTFLYDAIGSWDQEKKRFEMYYKEIIQREKMSDFTYALYMACKNYINDLQVDCNNLLSEQNDIT